MFAFQKYGIIPDILLLAKAMGGGMPIGALVAEKKLMDELSVRPMLGHITTFGGHPVCVAAALATLKVLHTGPYICRVFEHEEWLRQNLTHPLIREIRSSGMMMAVELTSPQYLTPVIEKCIENGVLVDYFLFNQSSFRIAPPLIAEKHHLKEGVDKILDALDDAHLNVKT
jgi:acetylornithine/succinyldiaminopimelate/putrescine aminotransferase